jgi:exopolyphosphatase/guanosine-5'-triphosphate,3'-diphosphate pyrophosphatase
VNHTRAIGTAALREAKNGNDIARILTASSGIPIEIIDGDTEAGYIFRGIKSGVPQLDKPALIMDIGGGSVEFILFQDHQILFKGSYKIGVALLYRKFHQGDPITPEAIRAIEDLLETELAEVLKTVGKSGAYYLIGASGSFEVIQDVLPKKQSAEHWSELDINTIDVYLDKIIRADLETRRIMPEIPEERLDYIVIAYILIRYIFKQIPPEKLFYCDFAVKEGILAEMMESL